MTSINLLRAREDEANCRRNLARLESELGSIKYALSGRVDVSTTARDLNLTSGLRDPDGDRLVLERRKLSLASAIETLGVRITDAVENVRALEADEPAREAEHRAAATQAATLANELQEATLDVHAAVRTLATASGRMRAAFIALLATEHPPKKIDATGEPERENFAPTTYVRFVADIGQAFSKMTAGSLFANGVIKPGEGLDFASLADRWSGSVRHKAEAILNPKHKHPAKAA